MKVIKISGVLLSLWLVAASSVAQSLLPDYWNDPSHEVAQPADNADMTEDNYVFQVQSLNSDQSDDEIEIYSSDGYIYIRSSKKQSAKVLTIGFQWKCRAGAYRDTNATTRNLHCQSWLSNSEGCIVKLGLHLTLKKHYYRKRNKFNNLFRFAFLNI